MGDIIKIWRVTILCIIIGMMAVTVVSAKEASVTTSKKVDNLAPPGTGYVIIPWTEKSLNTENSLSPNSLMSTLSTHYITQGQTITHYIYVSSGVNWLEVDVNWGDTSDSLALTIYSPSGVNLGTYYDNSDGSVNGRIHLNIYPAQGYIQSGTWTFKVYGASVSGTEDYTFNAALH